MKYVILSLLAICLTIGTIPTVSAESVPDWVKNTAGWSATDAISEKEFVNAIEFLVNEGIIVVEPTNSSKTYESKIVDNFSGERFNFENSVLKFHASSDGELHGRYLYSQEIIDKIVIQKNTLKNYEGMISLGDVSGKNLHAGNFADKNLSHVNFKGADLSYANFKNSDLSGADLSNTVLTNSKLSFATLKNSNLNNAVLQFAQLQNANLSNADLS